MKSLQEHLNESLVMESYKPKFKPADWEKVLKSFRPRYSNYSQLANIENCIVDEETSEEDMNLWIDRMIEGGVADTPENRDILGDIFMWVADNYISEERDCRDDMEAIIELSRNMEPGEWAVSAEEIVIFMSPGKTLSGTIKKYGEVLAAAGDPNGVADAFAKLSPDGDDDDDW